MDMTVPEIKNINVKQIDILNYILGVSNFDPIEVCIDSGIYEVFDDFIYNNKTKESLAQDEDYLVFCKYVSSLKSRSKEMQYEEILRMCEELEEISPKYIKL